MQKWSSRSGKVKRLLVIAVVVVLAGGGVAAALVMRSRAVASQTGEPEATSQEAKGPEKPAALPEVVDLGEFLVNVDSGGGMRYLRSQVGVEVTVKEEEKPKAGGEGEGKKKDYELPAADLLRAKDAVVKQLTASDFAKLRTVEGREELKKRLAQALAAALPKYEVGQVMLVSFVMQ